MTLNSKDHNPRKNEEILKIFIASSAELNMEREKIILIFNSMNKYLKHLKLEPIKWETDIESGNVEKKRIQDIMWTGRNVIPQELPGGNVLLPRHLLFPKCGIYKTARLFFRINGVKIKKEGKKV